MTPVQTWPALEPSACGPTFSTLHLYTQTVGKIQLALRPSLPQWEQAQLRLTPRGFATQLLLLPDGRTMTIAVDVLAGRVVVETSDGQGEGFPLAAGAIADFYGSVFRILDRLGAPVSVDPATVLLPETLSLAADTAPRAYEPACATAWFQALTAAAGVFDEFRAGFWGKQTPVGLWWATFDLSVTRFSSRPARPPQDAGHIDQVALDAEQATVGLWPGDSSAGARFFAYTYPSPRGLGIAPVRPDDAMWDDDLGQYVLSYDAVREASDPQAALLAFCESTYDAGARLGKWDRRLLDRTIPASPPQ